MVFKNRQEAGKKLGERLKEFVGQPNVLLFALPRGGVVLGAEVSKALKLPLDVIVTRKIGAPLNPEYAIGALAETGELVWNEAEHEAADPKKVQEIVEREQREAERRVQAYRRGRALPSFKNKITIIIDDGIATGLTMQAAVRVAQHQKAKKVIVAVPHGAKDSIATLRKMGVEVIALDELSRYGSVGQFYEQFPQVEDEEVLNLLKAT